MLIRRRLAGLLAICVFALSYGAALQAAVCSMDMSADMSMDMPMAPDTQDKEPHPPAPDCPLSMPGSATNCVFSSAVMPVVEPHIDPSGRTAATFAGDDSHYQLLLTHSAFHPPKV